MEVSGSSSAAFLGHIQMMEWPLRGEQQGGSSSFEWGINLFHVPLDTLLAPFVKLIVVHRQQWV